jgi:hypothetical protein
LFQLLQQSVAAVEPATVRQLTTVLQAAQVVAVGN